MDCLDTPDLELLILQALAANLSSDEANASKEDIGILTSGLPVVGTDAEEQPWDQSNINSAISYCNYVEALPSKSSRLLGALPALRQLLGDAKRGLRTADASSSAGRNINLESIRTVGQALFRAIAHLGAANPEASEEVTDLLCGHLAEIRASLHGGNEDEMAMAIVLLSNYHDFVLSTPLVRISDHSLVKLLIASYDLAIPPGSDNLEASLYSSQSGSPMSTSDNDGAIRLHASSHGRAGPSFQGLELQRNVIRRFSKLELAQKVLDIESTLMSQALVGQNTIEEPARFDRSEGLSQELQPGTRSFSILASRAVPESPSVTHFGTYGNGTGREILEKIASQAVTWWEDVMHGQGIGIDNGLMDGGNRSENSDAVEVLAVMAILKILTLSTLHAQQVDDAQLARLKLLLSDKTPVQHPKIIEVALCCVGMLALNFPYLGTSLTQHVKRFATSPLPVFEAEMEGTGTDVPEVMTATARCLAICVKTAPNDDLVNSTFYSLMHTVPHGTSMLEVPHAPTIRSSAVTFAGEKEGTVHRGRMAEQTRMASISTIGMVSKLALAIDKPESYQVTVNMLLQRLRGADAITEAAVVTNLVPLALRAPDAVLQECITAFSSISRSSNPEDPRYSHNAVLAAQTSLARGFTKRNIAAGRLFLEEMLALFIDKGSQIQTHSVSRHTKEIEKDTSGRVSEMTSQLAALLLPIDAILSNAAYPTEEQPSPDLVSSFRNMWFLCTLLGLTSPTSPYMTEPARACLARIAVKTPALVLEEEKDYASSVLEYNAVFRRDYAQAVTTRQRSALGAAVPKLASDVRNFSLPQVVFLQTVHDLETLRIQADRPSVHLQYFVNASLNESLLAKPLEVIADKLLRGFLARMSGSVLEHSMNGSVVSEEVRLLLIASTHRYRKVREVALKHLDSILTSFAALMCDRQIVFVLLEILTLLRRSCEDIYTDEYSPVYRYLSDKMDLCLEITDDFAARNEALKRLYEHACRWLDLAIGRAPIEMQTILQKYLKESRDTLLLDNVEMGAGVAMRYAKAISRLDRQEVAMPNIGGWQADSSNLLASQFAAKNYYSGELSGARFVLDSGLENLEKLAPHSSSTDQLSAFRQQMAEAVANIERKSPVMPVPALRRLLLRAVSALTSSPIIDRDILHYLVALPIRSFTALGIAAGVDAWTWLISERPDIEVALSSEISDGWLWTIRNAKGLFSDHLNSSGPFEKPIEYSPTVKSVMDHEMIVAKRSLQPHLLLTTVISSRFQAVKYRRPGIMGSMFRLLARSFQAHKQMSTHPLAREVRFSLVLFALQVLASSRVETLLEASFRDLIYAATLSWFAVRPMWSFGSNRIQVQAEIKLLGEVLHALQNDHIRGDHDVTSLPERSPNFPVPGYSSLRDYALQHAERSRLLQLLVENEINRLSTWSNPINAPGRAQSASCTIEHSVTGEQWPALVRRAWKIFPAAAVHMGERFKIPQVQAELARLIRSHPRAVIDVPEALHFLLGTQLESSAIPALKWLVLWAPVPPVTAVTYFQPRYDNNPLVLQYAMRALEQYPVDLTFFFVPQVVQALRSDGAGYVERFIFETSKISQLFCHQIIWNMKANCFKDDAGEIPDPMKPQLERMVDMVVDALSGKAKQFYDLEFDFFNEVTSISGKLKPYIKKSKPEKKAKIDEEMAKIKVSVGVYLPSNPDGVVVDLDRKSGRPLQSHAKAPFMATFKVRKEQIVLSDDVDGNGVAQKSEYDVWQAAIFKVGDDCRQDVLALQIIAMFKNVFLKAGLVLYLFPYRVTATAPGCGVIDVVPNATSRDEMGRAKINDLYGYFIDKYGGVDTPTFQKARLNFIQSMAAYSVACYILQIKDRHNGNIMIDGEGHIVHIDFGFLFDIDKLALTFVQRRPEKLICLFDLLRPGGVKFEPNSFKLNHEMVALMGGRDSQGFRMFSELTVKAFLAIRPYADQLVDTVHLMLGTGLPSFKGEPTIKRLRDRFQLQLSEEAAADYMVGVIKNANENYRSVVYDEFQRLQNGIPY